jgi:cellulose synthase/poly-beta-1,6-N-acetylglucosamine synthase-like glycosyltransferase
MRPPVTVIVPFLGSEEALGRCLHQLAPLAVREDDELVVADNRPSPDGGAGGSSVDVVAPGRPRRVRFIRACGVRSPGFARNRAAAGAAGDWLVFVDADTRPHPELLELYFDPPPSAATGLMAGGIIDVSGGPSLAARYSAARGQMSQQTTLKRLGTPYAQGANMAVRRRAFDAVGGFDENARSGEDADLSFRLAAAGWGMEERPRAEVEHLTRRTLAALVVQLARHGSGAAWLNHRYPGEFAPPAAHQLAARLSATAARALAAAMRGRREAAGAGLVELLGGCAFEGGRLLSNRAPRR